MAAMAHAAVRGGAAAIRADGPRDIAAIAATVDVPIIGINKNRNDDSPVYITPTRSSADALASAGASVIATDGTSRPRPHGETLADVIAHVHEQLHLPVMADIDTPQSAQFACEAGADLLATTLAGYTNAREKTDGPDLQLLQQIIGNVDRPVVAEGRFRVPRQVQRALDLGAYAVVVGTAITNPTAITRWFLNGTQ